MYINLNKVMQTKGNIQNNKSSKHTTGNTKAQSIRKVLISTNNYESDEEQKPTDFSSSTPRWENTWEKVSPLIQTKNDIECQPQLSSQIQGQCQEKYYKIHAPSNNDSQDQKPSDHKKDYKKIELTKDLSSNQDFIGTPHYSGKSKTHQYKNNKPKHTKNNFNGDCVRNIQVIYVAKI